MSAHLHIREDSGAIASSPALSNDAESCPEWSHLASISCRRRFPAGLGTHCGAALYQTCFLAILGLEPAEQDAQETDNFTDECLVMPCDVTAAALVEARRKMTIKAALFEHVLFFPNMLDSRGCL